MLGLLLAAIVSSSHINYMDIVVFFVSFVGPVVIVGYLIKADKPRKLTMDMFKVFLFGVLIALIAGELNHYTWAIDYPTLTFMAAIPEETLKYLVLFLYVNKRGLIKEPIDAIIYGVLISLTFAALENYIVYVRGSPFEIYQMGVIRTFSAVPMHAMCGVIMGFYFGLARFYDPKYNFAKALWVPMTIHASYNFFSMTLELAVIFNIALFIFTQRLYQKFTSLQ